LEITNRGPEEGRVRVANAPGPKFSTTDIILDSLVGIACASFVVLSSTILEPHEFLVILARLLQMVLSR
jgi:hypothetical protein